MSETHLTAENFGQEVLNASGIVLVDFWAEWCGPCTVLGPTIAEIGEEFKGKMKVGKVNVDEQGELAMQYNVMSIPTMKFFKDGKIVAEIVGAAPKATIVAELQKLL